MSVLSELSKKFGVPTWVLWVACIVAGVTVAKVFVF